MALLVVGVDWVVRRSAASGRAWLGVTVAGVVGALVVVPALVATWPHRAGGVERGSLAAVESVCDALSPGDVVLAVDSRAANEWPQVVRGMCGVPALSLTSRVRSDDQLRAATVDRVATGVEERGGRLVLLAADSADALTGLGATPSSVAEVTVREDEHVLERGPGAHRPPAGRRLARPGPVAAPALLPRVRKWLPGRSLRSDSSSPSYTGCDRTLSDTESVSACLMAG